ncbi:MAG: 50S ribosomal protein L10 [Ignavibacteriales bacterium]|nr:50S ribosomal protein L10 [Ignavibacteriales bacterium]
MNRSDKEQIIAAVQEKIARAKGMFFTDFTGITVEQMTELRREFRKSGIEYKVVKNTLVRKALENVTGYDAVYGSLVGTTGIAFSYDDPVTPAKIIKKFNEKNKKLSCKACVIEKEVFAGSKLEEFAMLPSRNEIISGILASLQSPASGIAGAINAVMRDLVGVIEAIEKKKAA